MKIFDKPFMFYAFALTVYTNTVESYQTTVQESREILSLLDQMIVVNGNGKVANEIKELGHTDNTLDLIRRISDYEVFASMNDLAWSFSAKNFIEVYTDKIKKISGYYKDINDSLKIFEEELT